MTSTIACKSVKAIPVTAELDTMYELAATPFDSSRYQQRVDRNLGFITAAEQEMVRATSIGVAGAGGMGGLLAATFQRIGAGTIKIADTEVFDNSNLNRQFAASQQTIGQSKALATAKLVRSIAGDSTLEVYPHGITASSVRTFVAGCDVIADEVEFWAIGSRILLHQTAREHGVPVFNGNSLGFGTRLFLFRPEDTPIEDCLGLSLPEAFALQEKIQAKTATPDEVRTVMNAVLNVLLPEIPEYSPHDTSYATKQACLERLFKEGTAPIIGTNPVMATGFLANHILLELLRQQGIKRSVIRPPQAPGYLYLDTALMQARPVERKEVLRVDYSSQ